ncbi:MAG: hypothetical protein RMJ67_02540 [Elusimicrobiota bacterium]|nr:hypothetical protein [Endomicrobiia bacterium]MDW8165375.1 hypothetical protein [Elusimicrobiota bacterium]
MQTFLIILLILSTLFLVLYEFYGIYRARKLGLTKNKSRMITHGIMVVLLILLLLIVINFIIQYYRITKILF